MPQNCHYQHLPKSADWTLKEYHYMRIISASPFSSTLPTIQWTWKMLINLGNSTTFPPMLQYTKSMIVGSWDSDKYQKSQKSVFFITRIQAQGSRNCSINFICSEASHPPKIPPSLILTVTLSFTFRFFPLGRKFSGPNGKNPSLVGGFNPFEKY